jgi:DNA-3-methyladenine glycosylase II
MRAYKLAQRRAEKHLTQIDRRMTKVIATHGKCALTPYWDRSPYESLVRAVAYQQLHARAAQAILGRLVERFAPNPFPPPAALAAADPAELRPLGFSAAKLATIQGIAQGALSGLVPIREEANSLSDEELIQRLTQLRGIGRWTVEMLLIFSLGRLDVMPVDDYGVKAGLQALHKLDVFPKKQAALPVNRRMVFVARGGCIEGEVISGKKNGQPEMTSAQRARKPGLRRISTSPTGTYGWSCLV